MIARLSACAYGLALLGSCYSITHEYDGPREITPGTRLTTSGTALGKVQDWKKATYLFWGLLPLNASTASAPGLLEDKAVAEHGGGVTGISDVRIHEEQAAIDIVVEILTLGLFTMVTIEAEGQVHGQAGAAGGSR